MKHWNLGIFGYWVIGAGFQIEKDLESSPSLPNCSKDYWKLLSLLTSINWPSLMASWFAVQNIYSKMYPVSCTNTHRDVTDLVNHGMVKNTKTWISWERNIIFLRNKKILNLCFRWHVLRSYRFVAGVIFKLSVSGSFFLENNFLNLHTTIRVSFPSGGCVDEAVKNRTNFQGYKYFLQKLFSSLSHIDSH